MVSVKGFTDLMFSYNTIIIVNYTVSHLLKAFIVQPFLKNDL